MFGILVVNLPSTGSEPNSTGHGSSEKARVYSEIANWITVDTRAEYERRYTFVPDRIVDNFLTNTALISVVPWAKATDPDNLRFLIDATFEDRKKCTNDLHRHIRRTNGN